MSSAKSVVPLIEFNSSLITAVLLDGDDDAVDGQQMFVQQEGHCLKSSLKAMTELTTIGRLRHSLSHGSLNRVALCFFLTDSH